MRDMFVFDWLFGHRKKESFWEQNRRENPYINDSHDDYHSSRGNNHCSNNDYVQQEFFASKALRDDDDDLDSGMCDDDF